MRSYFNDEDIYTALNEYRKQEAIDEIDTCFIIDVEGNVL